MHLTALFVFLFFGSVETCLVVNQVACECSYIPLSIGYFPLDDFPRDWNYTNNAAMAPVVSSSGCSLSMSCPEGYNLIIHDTNTSSSFGAYAAEGFCDAMTQKWRVANQDGTRFSIFDRMYGICVDYTNNRPLSYVPENNCTCDYTLIDNSNAKTRLGYHDYYVSHLSKYELSLPKMSMTSSGTCPKSFDCGSLSTVLIADDKVYEDPTGEYACNPREYWNFTASFIGAGYLFVTCMDLSKPREPVVTPKCNCKYELIANQYIPARPFLFVGDQISEDRCIWTIYCQGYYKTDLKLFNDPNQNSTSSYIWQGKCNQKTNEWDMIWEPYQGQVYRNVPVFGFNCVFYR